MTWVAGVFRQSLNGGFRLDVASTHSTLQNAGLSALSVNLHQKYGKPFEVIIAGRFWGDHRGFGICA